MNWRNVKLIFARELKDQLRDRRTLFTVLVLPVLLYPLLGMALLQVSQFSQKHSTTIWMVGTNNLPDQPPLLIDGELNPQLLDRKATSIQMVTENSHQKITSFVADFYNNYRDDQGAEYAKRIIQHELKKRHADLAVFIPQPIDIDVYFTTPPGDPAELPRIYLFLNSAKDKSNLAAKQFTEVMQNWKQLIGAAILQSNHLDAACLETFQTVESDVAERQWKQAASWSKILPFIVMIWSLTGAFYPAVDLCAGEKERGTFETLLSSPALRNEIAFGKLLTVISFSITTSVLNLASMGFTGLFVVSRLNANWGGVGGGEVPLGLPPFESFFWLLLALIPISALFSAVALAAASFAKSSKEGQYYLVPLMMISFPLMLLPMVPAARLDLGSSLIPVSGLMLMLKGLIEGQYSEVLQYGGVVVAVTMACCWLSIRWVVLQFNSESVLFRPSERFSVRIWLQQMVSQRHDLPLVSQALLCGLLILIVKFFVSMGAGIPENWAQFAKQTIVVLVASVGIPAILMAMFLTRDPARALKIRSCRLPVACAAVLAAIFLHPSVTWLTQFVFTLYPPSGELALVEGLLVSIFSDAPGLVTILLVMALAPAIIEEFAFRGFILSGFQSSGNQLRAVILSSLLFGIAHTILQQSIVTFFVGCMLGFIAVRANSIIPCILYHFVHNSLSVGIAMVNEEVISTYPLLKCLLSKSASGGYEYWIWPASIMTICGALLILWFWNYQSPAKRPHLTPRADIQSRFETFVARISSKT